MADRAPHARVSPNARRARQLLTGGAIGGNLALVACVLGFGVAAGLPGAASAGVAGALVIAFFVIGQLVMVWLADADPRRVLLAALISYAGRVGALGALLALVLANRARFAGMDPTAVVITTIAVVVGWLAGEIRAFSRLRIPVFDETERPTDSL